MSLDELLPKEAYSLLYKESRVYKQVILHRWAAIDYRRLGVKFERIDFSERAIHYKIAVMKPSLFYRWTGRIVNALPYGVYVFDLVSEETLSELSIACQRRVTAEKNINGVWLIVHRSAPDYDPRSETHNLLDELRSSSQ